MTVTVKQLSSNPVIKTQVAEGCYIYQSFSLDDHGFVKPCVSFLADSGDGTAAEWECSYGPISIITECDRDWDDTDWSGPVAAKPHWHFDFIEGRVGVWSQLAVDQEGLKDMLIAGNLEAIFEVLMRWARKT